jgi:NAD(P)-dependent dehydrogenase (short-subunit alcohol dehydrogenase family)
MMPCEAGEDGERGVVILTASIAAYEGQIGQSAYAASKAAIVGLVLPAAREFAAQGIRVNAIAPGVFETPMVGGMPDEVKKSLYATVPFPPRFGRADERQSPGRPVKRAGHQGRVRQITNRSSIITRAGKHGVPASASWRNSQRPAVPAPPQGQLACPADLAETGCAVTRFLRAVTAKFGRQQLHIDDRTGSG